MARQITVEIPLLVGSNGKWCANGYTSTEKDGADWGFMVDSLEGDDGKYPSVERRYVVRATVLVPDDVPDLVVGVTELAAAEDETVA